MSVGILYEVLFAALAVSLLVSFGYMAKSRGVLSALLWTFAPLRYWLGSASGTSYDDNPSWLDRVQLGLILAIALLWLAAKVKWLT